MNWEKKNLSSTEACSVFLSLYGFCMVTVAMVRDRESLLAPRMNQVAGFVGFCPFGKW